MAVEGREDFSEERRAREKVTANKRLLIWVPCVVCPGNIKVIPFRGRSAQGSLPVYPLLSSVFVMPKYPNLESFWKRLKAACCFVLLCFCLCLTLSQSICVSIYFLSYCLLLLSKFSLSWPSPDLNTQQKPLSTCATLLYNLLGVVV